MVGILSHGVRVLIRIKVVEWQRDVTVIKKSKQLKSDAGFTLIELMIAFTILSLVVGSLFQIFFVSTKNNEKAYEFDMANNLAITAMEHFKAEPALYDEYMLDSSPESSRVFKYYDKEWQELKLSPVMQDQSRTAPDNAVYEMEMRVIRENAADSTENQLSRQAASVLYLDETEHYRIVLNEYVQDLEILFNGRLYAVKHAGNRKTLSLQLVLSEAGVLPKNVIVVNKTNLKADIRVFNVPDISEERRHEYINVESTEGNFSVMYLNEQFKTIENVVYFADISVKKIMENDEELVRIQTQKYVAG